VRTGSSGFHRRRAWLQFIPSVWWLASYRIGWLGSDIVAGVPLAAYAIPVSLAYAALAGLPPQVGIYGYLLRGVGYALFGSSRQLAVGPTSAVSLMIAASVGVMAEGDAHRYAQIAGLAGFTVAMLCLVACASGTNISRARWCQPATWSFTIVRPPSKPCSSRNRSKMRLAVCCCFFGRFCPRPGYSR
jgi:hypothetical protein